MVSGSVSPARVDSVTGAARREPRAQSTRPPSAADTRPRTARSSLLKAQAYGLGFDLVGIATLGPAETAAAFDAWVARGYAGEMDYLPRGAAKRRDKIGRASCRERV